MRIIAGTWRGRRLESPDGRGTRPMMDRVKEAIFSVLAPWLEGADVLDLFAGTGGLGLEALSRGARSARFSEMGSSARKHLENNVRALGASERAKVVGADALRPSTWGAEPFDIVFLDPPFPMVRDLNTRREVLSALEALATSHLAPEGVIVLHVPRHALRASELAPSLVAKEREYGAQSVWFVQFDEEYVAEEQA